MVALMMLVFLTLTAVGMSRNAFREIVSSGFSRQGAMARDVADSGLEWALFWANTANSGAATGDAQKLANEMNTLRLNNSQAGVAYNLSNGLYLSTGGAYNAGGPLQGDMKWTAVPGVNEGYTIGVTRMGKLPLTGMSQGAGPGAYAPASGGLMLQAPDLWAIRSDAQVIQGGVTFIHAREAWISTPVQ
jgi:Tfp pilus assembly protein PilX